MCIHVYKKLTRDKMISKTRKLWTDDFMKRAVKYMSPGLGIREANYISIRSYIYMYISEILGGGGGGGRKVTKGGWQMPSFAPPPLNATLL